MNGSSAPDVLLGLMGLLFAAIGTAAVVFLVRRHLTQSRALAHGIQVEARCLEAYMSTDSKGDSHRVVILGFTTREGREIRIKPTVPRLTVVGDFVPVRYLPERPEQAAVVGSGGPAEIFGLVFGLVVCAIFALFGLAFAAHGFGLGAFVSGSGPFGNGVSPSAPPTGYPFTFPSTAP